MLSTILDKVNNPSPDDPFEPEIAAVSGGLAVQRMHTSDGTSLKLLKNDESKFLATAKEWTKKCVSKELTSTK